MHIKSSPMYVTSQCWKSEQVCSSGGPKEPAQLHSLLNVGIQNGLSLLREDIKLQRCWAVLPLPLCHLSETSTLSSPGWRDVLPSWDCPQGKGDRELWPPAIFCSSRQPALSFWWRSIFFCRLRTWGKDKRVRALAAGRAGSKLMWPWRGCPAVELVSVSCAFGKIPNTFWQKGCELTVQSGGFPVLFALPFSAALMLVSLTLQAQLYSSEVRPCAFSWLHHPSSALFFRLLPILFPPLHSLSVYSLHYEDGNSECIRPGCFLPSSFYLASFSICEFSALSVVEQHPLTSCNMGQRPLLILIEWSWWNQHYEVTGKEDSGANAVLCWLRVDFWCFPPPNFHSEMWLLILSAVPSSQVAFSSFKSDAVFSYSVLVVPDHFWSVSSLLYICTC